MGPESTNAPSIGEEDREQPYATGGVELLDKFLQGRLTLIPRALLVLITIIWFGFISFLFVNDNELGRLDTIEGIEWFGAKALVYSILFGAVALIIWFASKPLRGSHGRP
jgi:hypothetical protein